MSRGGPSRRCLLASLAFLSLSGYLLAGLAPGVGCPNDNPFIVIMKKDGVQLYDTPKQVSHICKAEFENYGTCCDETRLHGYAQADTAQIMNAQDKVVAEFSHLVKMAKEVVTALEILNKASVVLRGEFVPENQEFSNAAHLLTDRIVTTIKAHIAKLGSPVAIGEFSVKNAECWEAVSQLRSKAICSYCSGRANHFFKNKKILIPQQTCNNLNQICSRSLSIVVDSGKFLADLENFAKQTRDSGLDINLASILDLGKVAALKKYAGEIEKALSFASNPNQLQMLSSLRQTQLCHTFLNIKHTSAISKVESITASTSQAKWAFKPNVGSVVYSNKSKFNSQEAAFLQAHQSLNPKWETSNMRLLQFGGNPGDDFIVEDATIIDPQDSSYSSTGVSGHGPISEETQP